MNWSFESMHSFIGGGMWIFWLILLVIIVFFIKTMGVPSKNSESAMELLKKRYANGDLNSHLKCKHH